MKVLYFNGFFELPDDFDGKFPDALRELAAYDEDGGRYNPNHSPAINAGETPVSYHKLWAEFLVQAEAGDRVLGYGFVGEMTADGSVEYDELGELKT